MLIQHSFVITLGLVVMFAAMLGYTGYVFWLEYQEGKKQEEEDKNNEFLF